MQSDRSYIENLRQTSVGLALQAAEARRRQIYGLEQAFTQAAESAASWAAGLEEDVVQDEIERAG